MAKEPPDEILQLKRSRRRLWFLVGLATIGVFLLTLLWSEPPPPHEVVLATGAPGGGYSQFGATLAELVESESGLRVEQRSTAGSAENLALLREHDADVAFVQSGVPEAFATLDGATSLRSIARIYSEPLWVFYRGTEPVTLLTQLRGKRLAIGPEGSGTNVIASAMLKTNGLDESNTQLASLDAEAALAAFRARELDAVFFVASPQAEWIKELLEEPEARLMNFVRYLALSRKLARLGVKPIEIPQGLIDLKDNLPASNVTLLAPTAMLMTRADVHPRVVELFTRAAVATFGAGNLIDYPGEFPSIEGLDRVHDAASRYLREGESWLSRNLPYWAVRTISRVKLLLIPLITVLLPAFKLVPVLLRLRVRHLLKKHYEYLRDVETRIQSAPTPAELEQELDHLRTLREELSKLSRQIPGTYQDNLYHWRMHIDLVQREGRERLEELQASG